MAKTDAELAHKRFLGFIWLTFVCFFNTAPLFVISILANLDSVCFHICFIYFFFNVMSTFVDQSIRPLLAAMVYLFSVFLCRSVGCVTTSYFWTLQFLPAYHHALVDQGSSHLLFHLSTILLIIFLVYGGFDALSARSGCYCKILQFLDYQSAHHFHAHWCSFQ